MKIHIRNHQRTVKVLQPALLRSLLKQTAHRLLPSDRFQPCDGLEFHLLGPRAMADLNEQFLQHAGATDVITFSYLEEADEVEPEGRTLGEVFVCPAVAAGMAGQFAQTLSEEILLYMIHGLLHLSGLDDQTPAQRRVMRRAEQKQMDLLRAQTDLTVLLASSAKH